MSALSMEELLTVEEYKIWKDIRTDELRRAAFTLEADPLFMQYMRGEATKEEWLAKEASTMYTMKILAKAATTLAATLDLIYQPSAV